MNGIHDMGGMQDMGPVQPEKDEPVFHFGWEARTFALGMAAGVGGRYDGELIPPAEYLRMTYYERALAAFTRALEKAGIVSASELSTGKALGGKIPGRHVLSVAEVAKLILPEPCVGVPHEAAHCFEVGWSVRAREMNPVGHTRLPRYVRGRIGTITRLCGVQPLWDTDGEGRSISSKPQPVYTVRFAARELWGDKASFRDSINVDMWEDYLELP